MKNKLITAYYTAKNAIALKAAGIDVYNSQDRESGDHLLEVLGTIVIAIVILLIFRNQIIDLFTAAMNKTKSHVTNQLFDSSAGSTTGYTGGTP